VPVLTARAIDAHPRAGRSSQLDRPPKSS